MYFLCYDGNIEGYRYRGDDSVYGVVSLGIDFYDKVVLSGSPSAGGIIALVVHAKGKRLSFAGPGRRQFLAATFMDRER
jgi:hypothetical protein